MEKSASNVSNRTAFIVAVLILLFAIVMLVAAQDFPGGSGVFPRFAGWIFVALAALEVIVYLKVMLVSGMPGTGSWIDATVIKEIKGFLWTGFFLLVLYLAGFMIGIPLYLCTFLRLSAGRSWRQCLMLSAGATLFVYLLFIGLLEYRLYAGVLFGN